METTLLSANFYFKCYFTVEFVNSSQWQYYYTLILCALFVFSQVVSIPIPTLLTRESMGESGSRVISPTLRLVRLLAMLWPPLYVPPLITTPKTCNATSTLRQMRCLPGALLTRPSPTLFVSAVTPPQRQVNLRPLIEVTDVKFSRWSHNPVNFKKFHILLPS